MTRRFCVLAVLLLGALAWAVPAAWADGPNNKDNDTHVQLLAINDLHGNLQPPTGSGGRISVGVGQTVDAGGVEYLATWIKQLRERNSNTLFVGAGDQIGASPLISGLFHDEPTIESLNLMGMDVSGVGNHEFDEGVNELLRMQNGGCHPVDGCQDGDDFSGAFFQYLAANVFYAGTDRTILPAFWVRKFDNAKIAFIGLTLEGTPLIVTPAGVAGLEFRPEVPIVNALVRSLRETQGIRSFVILLHQGGQQNPPFANGFVDVNRCDNLTGDIAPIVQQLDPQVDVVVSGHTHQPYVCPNYAGTKILLTSASSFGRLVTDIDLTIDHQTKDVVEKTARNVIVTRNVPKDADQTKLIGKYAALSAPIANRVVGSQSADITRATTFAGESALGDVIADAQLASTSPTDFGGAAVAFMNPGGIRADLICSQECSAASPAPVTYNQLFTVQPFNNVMTVKTLTGAQIYHLLNQQWSELNAGVASPGRILQVSNGFTYTYDSTRPATDRVIAGSVKILGVPVDPLASYRVAMNNFLAGGGDGFTVFAQGTDQLGGEIDLDALVNYFLKNSPVGPGPQNRITRIG